MRTHSSSETVVVEVPLTMRIAVAFPDGAPADARQAAYLLAAHAVKSLTHVGAPQLHAFNEVNRLHPHGAGMVQSAECHPAPTFPSDLLP